MKTCIVLIIIASLTSSCSLAQTNLFPIKPWKAEIKVLDGSGKPLSGVNVEVGYIIMPTLPGEKWGFGERGGKIEGLSDTNGLFTATHADRSPSLGFHLQKDGYYKTFTGHEMGFPEQNGNRNVSMTLVLKKIGKPIAMYAKRVNLGLPVFDKPAGFDLMIGDWVAPYGTGINTDIIFTGHLDKRAKNDSDYTLTVSFPNSGDGIQDFIVPESEKGSELRSPHEAPAEDYKAEWVQTKTRRPGKQLQTNWDMNRNYFFRVRTKLDDKGNVVSARYGKIYGDFMNFTYYLNPTPNNRNIEFDPSQNLIHSLKFDEGVSAP